MTTRQVGRGPAYAALTTTALTTALLLTGCGSGAGTDSAQSEAAMSQDSADGGGSRLAGDPSAEQAGQAGQADQAEALATSSRVAPAVARRAVIATATVALDSPDVARARQEVQRVADALGGEVSDEQATTDDGEVSWTRLVLRIPTDRYDDAVERIEETGRLLETERSTEDVTTQVIDNEVRIRAQERSLRRVEVLLDRADRIADVVSVEAELTRRQAELDSLKQQQAYLADQTSMATVTVHISRRSADEEPVAEDDDGFLHGLAAGWSSLSGAAVALATLAGVLLPWLVVLAVLGVPLWWAVRRLPRRRSPGQPGQATG